VEVLVVVRLVLLVVVRLVLLVALQLGHFLLQ
jgi:hypothetical protein